VIACLRALGLPTGHEALVAPGALEAGLEEFREHLGGRLTISMLRAPGKAEDVHQIDAKLMRECAEELAHET
jgi:3-dehydroquinate synthase